jgi:carbamoyl-phosphate synthase/aspartate carbamoyltransferase
LDSPAFQRRARALSRNEGREVLKSAKERGVIVLGCGAYCIGSSVEFDWCAVSCIRQLRRDGFKSIIINYNPETVSTDYDESDRLYFEELSLERVMDIYERENPTGVVVSVGGQIPNNLADALNDCGANILGTSAVDIERAEDRQQFSKMLDTMSIQQPEWSVLNTKEEAVEFSRKVGFPVLVRPSFVLSGAAMRVAADETQLTNFLVLAADVSGDKPVVVTKFIEDAKEIEFDGVANKGDILNYAIGEHLENAGVHSGDATVVLPAQKLYVKTIKQVKRYASAIAKALRITGPFNIQFMAKGNNVQVIECNLRASRTFPFVSKTLNHNFISLATQAMTGLDPKPYKISLLDIDYVCVKVGFRGSMFLDFIVCYLPIGFRLPCSRSLVSEVPILHWALRWLLPEKSPVLAKIKMKRSSRLCCLQTSSFPRRITPSCSRSQQTRNATNFLSRSSLWSS